MNNSKQKVIVGMSGGVDSSVSALLLKQQGFHVEGLFMKNWNEDDGTEYCTAVKDLLDAAAVCQKLGIHLHTANFAGHYWENVFQHFLTEYQAGRTPNPDILCNREIKFKVFLEYAEMLGADFIATGHYAQTLHRSSQTFLCKGLDANKDQSYFLHAVSENEFAKTLFPIGGLEKSEVRRIAEQNDLVTHNKKDSTGICFIGERRFKDFLQTYLPAQPGDIIDEQGNVIGQHQGLMYHTIGQRQGLGIGGVQGAKEEPWYVYGKDLLRNRLLVVQGGNHPLLFHNTLIASQIHWINNTPPPAGSHLKAKTRYRQADQDCVIHYSKRDEADINNNQKFQKNSQELLLSADDLLTVSFDQAQRAITPGQSVVFYQDDICLGGAIIERAENH